MPVQGKSYSIDDNETDGFCYLCQKVYELAEYLEHLRKIHQVEIDLIVRERRCNYSIPIPDITNPDYYCRACKNSYGVYSNYRRHLQDTHHFILPSSTRTTINSKRKSTSIRSGSLDKDRPHFCYECQKGYSDRYKYRRHLETTHKVVIPAIKSSKDPNIVPDANDPNFHCRSCDQNYYFASRHRSHLRSTHQMTLEPANGRQH